MTIDGTAYLSLTVETLLSDNSPVEPTCHVTDDGDKTVTYRVVRVSDTVIKTTDFLYNFECNQDTATGVEQTITAMNVQTIGSSLDVQPTLTASTQNVAFELLTSTGTAVTSPATFGGSYKFRVTLTREGVINLPLFLQCKGLMASDTDTFTTTEDMLTSEGCLPTTPKIALQSVFAVTGTPTTASTTIVAETGTFDMPVFATGVNTINFKFMFELSCYLTTDAKCMDPATYCAGIGRRRRSTDEQVENGTLTLAVDVSFGGSGSTSGLGGNKGSTETMSEKECEVVTSFWVVSIVLGILLLIVLVFAVMLFFRLKLERRSKLVDDRSGISNPNF